MQEKCGQENLPDFWVTDSVEILEIDYKDSDKDFFITWGLFKAIESHQTIGVKLKMSFLINFLLYYKE